MKKSFLIISLLLLTLGICAKGKQIIVFHTNDTHSQIYPFNPNLLDTVKAGRGGFLRRASYISAERDKYGDKMLLLDSGDFSQGSPYYTMYKGDVEIGLMNIMGYDAATIGNHEFDFGLENMARLFQKAKFPIVCANYEFRGTPCENYVKPYVVLKRNGVKIGIFGLSPKIEGLVSGKNSEGVKFLEPIPMADLMVKQLRQVEKCDIVICLSHLGYKTGDPNSSDEELAAKTSGIDLILGGHTHTYLEHPETVTDQDGKDVTIDQNGKSGIYMSKLTLELE